MANARTETFKTRKRDNRGGFHLLFLAAVGGGRSDYTAVERVFAVDLAFALQGLAHFLFSFYSLTNTLYHYPSF